MGEPIKPDLVLHLKRQWFAKVWNGEKNIEYRAKKKYWDARIPKLGKRFFIEFRLTMKDGPRMLAQVSNVKIGKCPYPGWAGKFYHIHFDIVGHYLFNDGAYVPFVLVKPPRMKELKDKVAPKTKTTKSKAIPKISAERFNIRNWECSVWDRFDLLFSQTLDNQTMARKIAYYAIGWCESNRLSVRPRKEDWWVAILCEDKDGVFWFHERREVMDMANKLRNEYPDDITPFDLVKQPDEIMREDRRASGQTEYQLEWNNEGKPESDWFEESRIELLEQLTVKQKEWEETRERKKNSLTDCSASQPAS